MGNNISVITDINNDYVKKINDGMPLPVPVSEQDKNDEKSAK